ncbi:MAG: hypothetical protein K9G26_04695 [Emcibacter sp.]|nr:hypothetical protein [Emcibacter sp.]
MVSYTHRHSYLTKMRTYQVGDKSLRWQDDEGLETTLTYKDIISVEGQYTPSRVQPNRYRLRINSHTKGSVDITNTTYKGYGEFKENNDSYIPFVKDLHRKMVNCNPSINFKKGISLLGYILSIVTVAFLLIVVIVAGYFFFIYGLITIVIIKTAFVIYYFPSLIRYIKNNKPGIYDPINLPPEIIPL